MNRKSTLRTLLGILSIWSFTASADGILPQSLIVSLQIEEVFEYRCSNSNQCQIRCSSAVSDVVDYQNVKRLQLARGNAHWVFGAVYTDSLGIGHRTSGFLPEPASCVFDDLEFVNSIPVIDGAYNREPDEVIFDMSPSN